jgi:hypothetical protein
MRTIGALLVAGVLLVSGVAGCEKDTRLSNKKSGALRAQEKSLLAHLPSGNVGLFGGNYLRLQDFFQKSAFSKLMGNMDQISPGMKTWTECFVGSDASKLRMMGAVAYAGDNLIMRFVMTGWSVADVQRCAQKAGFPVDVDADGKFVAIGLPTAMGPMRTGYLVLDDGAMLTRTAMAFPPTAMGVTPTTRADLEADMKLVSSGTAADDASLVAELAKIDRDRAMWFVADASSTPIGDKLGTMRGWIDIDGGLAMDVSFQLKDKGMADEISRGVPEMKQKADMLGKDVAAVVRSLKFDRDGERLRFAIKISDQQLEKLVDQLAPFMGRGLGGGGL